MISHNRNIKTIGFMAVVCPCVMVGGYVAMAADPMANIPVESRNFKGFEVKGFQLGTFRVFPTLDTSVEYTSNVLKTSSNEHSEKISRTQAQVAATSGNSRYDIAFQGGVEYLKYWQTDAFDQINFNGYAGVNYNFSPLTKLEITSDIEKTHQTKYDVGTITASFEPISVVEYGVDADLTARQGSIGWGIEAGAHRFDHDNTVQISDGAQVIQEDRNRTEYYVGANTRYHEFSEGVGAGYTPYMGFRMTRVDYDKNQYNDGSGQFDGDDLSSMIYSIFTGIDLDNGSRLRGKIHVGYGAYQPDDANVASESTGLVDIDLTYLYSPLTNFIFGAERFFSMDNAQSGGVVQTKLEAKMVHELTRRWVWDATLGYRYDDYASNIENTTWQGGVGFGYKVNRNIALGADVDYITRDSNQDGGDYDDVRAMIRLNSKF